MLNEGYLNKIKNKLYICLCEREANKDWQKNLDSIIIEFMGFPDEQKTINYYIIMYKLNACRYLSFEYFRKTIFDVMNLLGRGEQ